MDSLQVPRAQRKGAPCGLGGGRQLHTRQRIAHEVGVVGVLGYHRQLRPRVQVTLEEHVGVVLGQVVQVALADTWDVLCVGQADSEGAAGVGVVRGRVVQWHRWRKGRRV